MGNATPAAGPGGPSTEPAAPRVAGADVCRGRWLAVVLADGAFESAHLAPTLTDLVPLVGPIAALAVDIPIGLPAPDEWPRAADLEARRLLGPMRSSVFPTPPRPVLFDCDDYAAANALHRELTGKGMSKQAWALREKILEADAFAADAFFPAIEVHPEVSFRRLHRQPLLAGKRTWNGQLLRRRLLADAGVTLPDHLHGKVGTAPADDLLDAAVAAWSAWRFASADADRIGTPVRDELPLPAAGLIWS